MAETVKVAIADLSKTYNSKLDLYAQLSQAGKYLNLVTLGSVTSRIGNFLLPAYKLCTYKFMIDICEGKKDVFTC